MSISATINSPNKKNVVAVTIPGPKGDSGKIIAANTLHIGDLANVDIDNITNGSILVYNTTTTTWVAQNEIVNNMIISGGNF